MGLLITNGIVYDPINQISGEKVDISVKDGKIVSGVKNPKTIDAGGRIVMPGGVDMHTHIAGGKMNVGRMLRPEDGRRGIESRKKLTRACTGYSVPNTFATGYRYAKMGYTTTFEPAMPPLLARHTHEEFRDIPIVDKGAIPLLDNHWLIMEYVKSGDMDKLAAYIAWMMNATKGYGIKIVNAGGGEAWGWGKNVRNLDDIVPNFDITPADIIHGLAEANERLNLPHSIHIHCNNLGHPGNYDTTLATFDLVKDIPSKKRQVMHATHVQFHSYGGSTWVDMGSKADAIASYVNSHDHVTIDPGQVMFGDTTTMTADGPMEYELHRMSRRKWTNKDVELETGSGIIPVSYSRKVSVNSIQWAIGLELVLLIKNPWKTAITTDHPNGAPFTRYPEIISLLMSKKRREEALKGVHDAINKRAIISSIDRELNWADIAIMTRASPAKLLGLDKHGKGHLGIGADADIAIYDVSPEEDDPRKIQSALSHAKYTIKGGEIVVKDGEIVAVPEGRTYWVNPEFDGEATKAMLEDLAVKFKEYYSVNMANYPVQDAYVPHPIEIKTKV
ncbi:MAG: formylmethanofuran dehydrogenase subunit A [Methanocellales archaeon]|nr:formylmethanofuran dehydrogenase subunit A [Methanocellales archaeon]MDD3291460.1 formylmethanofuran dehydrogenase subunit A [Methanocellales archaeon]MDD5234650.1 formylmethanofuran dehydrogenase subunit A [Methanocellales archaeon]MDD5484997.1 formylmethanofuran dehydrogenase subunit A [Methanocellales archaeon]